MPEYKGRQLSGEKDLPCKPGDLSLILRTHVKRQFTGVRAPVSPAPYQENHPEARGPARRKFKASAAEATRDLRISELISLGFWKRSDSGRVWAQSEVIHPRGSTDGPGRLSLPRVFGFHTLPCGWYVCRDVEILPALQVKLLFVCFYCCRVTDIKF